MSRRGSVLEGIEFKGMDATPQYKAAELGFQNRQLDMQNQQHKAAQKGQNNKDATDFIEGLGIKHSGLNPLDVTTDKLIQGKQKEYMDLMANGADVTAIRMLAQRELPVISNVNTAARNKYDEINKSIGELAKDYPTGDASKAKEIAVNWMLNDFYTVDDKGNYKPKDISVIPLDKNYTSDLISDENLGKWYKPSDALAKGVAGLPMTTYDNIIETRDKNGRTIKNKYSGQLNAFTQVIQDPTTGEPKAIGVKSERVTLGDNPDGTPKTIDVLPKPEFELLTDTPQKKADFNEMFKKHLQDNQTGDIPHGWNDDVRGELDPRARDIMERGFAKSWLEETKIHGGILNKQPLDREPLPPRVGVKVNTGGKEPANAIDVYSGIAEKANDRLDQNKYKPVEIGGRMIPGVLQANLLNDNEQAVVVAKANAASPGNQLGIDNIYIKKFPDGVWIMRAEDNVPLTKLTPTGTNVTANQPLGVKSKQEAVKEAKGKEKNTAVKTFNVVDPSTGKIILQGVDESSANKAKAKGYKIQ